MILLTRKRGFASALLGQRIKCLIPTILSLLLASGCGGQAFPFFPSEADLRAFDASQETFNERVVSLPLIKVRIVNETSVLARVEIVSGLTGPEFPESEAFGGLDIFGSAGPFVEQIDLRTVLVAPEGTVAGTLKCGEVIGVSANAPNDQVGQDGFRFGSNAFGLFVSNGNIAFSGIGAGTDGEDLLAGDTVYGARFVQPEKDGMDCETDTLVIRILAPASISVYDSETGQILIGASYGDGTLSLE